MEYIKLSFKNLVGNICSNRELLFFIILLCTSLSTCILLTSNLNGEIKNIALNPECMRTIKYSISNTTTDSEKDKLIHEISALDSFEKAYKTDKGFNVVADTEENSYILRRTIAEKYNYSFNEVGLNTRHDYTESYNSLTQAIKVLTVLIVIISIIIYSLNIYKQVLGRAKEYALYKALGFKRIHIYRIVLYENAFITVLALIISYLLSIGLVKLFIDKILTIILETDHISMNISFKPFFIVAIIILAILLLGADESNHAYKKVSTAELFKEE